MNTIKTMMSSPSLNDEMTNGAASMVYSCSVDGIPDSQVPHDETHSSETSDHADKDSSIIVTSLCSKCSISTSKKDRSFECSKCKLLTHFKCSKLPAYAIYSLK